MICSKKAIVSSALWKHGSVTSSNKGTPAVIGDNVYIGPNVCIVENVRVGNNVTIGAGAVVTKDIPDNATTVGVPAKVLHYNNPGKYIKNPFVFWEWNNSLTDSSDSVFWVVFLYAKCVYREKLKPLLFS